MSRLLDDILREPGELTGCIETLLGPERRNLERAAALVSSAPRIYITGIGSSWHAALAIAAVFERGGVSATPVDASEMLYGGHIPPGSAVIVLSRSGRSVEIVRLLERLRDAGAHVIGITNTPGSPLDAQAEVSVQLRAAFDHSVSVTMYSGIALAGGLLGAFVNGTFDDALAAQLRRAVSESQSLLHEWRTKLEESPWLDANAPAYYLLGRGSSLGSCHEARLVWEEAAKTPAAALTTGGFRHGPQEIVTNGTRVALWVQPELQFESDLVLAADLESAGASVCVIGQGVPDNAAVLVFNVPPLPPVWQFVLDIIPAQLAAERLASLRGEDCDSFRYCPYIIESETGLGTGDAGKDSQ